MAQPGAGFGVDLNALAEAERGVRDAVAELNEMYGWGGGEANVGAEGRGLEHLHESATPDTVGHDGLSGALALFVEKWTWGVKFLVEDGVDCADALRDTRSVYEKADDAAATAVKRVLHVFGGNPVEDADAWDNKDWSQIRGETAPDWSAESARHAEQQIHQTFGG